MSVNTFWRMSRFQATSFWCGSRQNHGQVVKTEKRSGCFREWGKSGFRVSGENSETIRLRAICQVHGFCTRNVRDLHGKHWPVCRK